MPEHGQSVTRRLHCDDDGSERGSRLDPLRECCGDCAPHVSSRSATSPRDDGEATRNSVNSGPRYRRSGGGHVDAERVASTSGAQRALPGRHGTAGERTDRGFGRAVRAVLCGVTSTFCARLGSEARVREQPQIRPGRVQPFGQRRRTVGVASGAGRGGGLLEKYRFMSPAWIKMAQDQIAGVLAGEDLRGIDFTLCEEFTGAPDDLRPEGAATIGFFVRVADDSVEVGDHPTDDADFKIVSDYEDALAIAHDPDAPVAQQSMMEARMAEGRLKIVGNPTDVPAILAGLDIHRLLLSARCSTKTAYWL